MNWFLLFAGLGLVHMPAPASAGMVCRILGVVAFVLGALLAILPALR